jgi:3-hydroxyisobutyrate dehydrogenase-like beta-hydroxyacid dehydrogenase
MTANQRGSDTDMNSTIGFIGLGNMGGRMARCLVSAGREVVGFDPRMEATTAAGAEPVASPAEVAARCDVVLLSLPDSHVVESVVSGDGGVIESIRAGQVIVDLSTSAPTSTRVIAQRLGEHQVTFLDAGISGGAAAAEKAALTLMVGGDQAVLDQIRPVLDLIASNIFYCGPSGSGHTAKVLNNFLNAVALAATAEAMVVAKKDGLDLKVFLDVLNVSSGINFATLNRFPKIITGNYLKGGLSNALMAKDMSLYLDLAASLGVTSLNAAGPMASFGLALQLGYGDQISNTVVDAIGDVSGGVRLYDGERSDS